MKHSFQASSACLILCFLLQIISLCVALTTEVSKKKSCYIDGIESKDPNKIYKCNYDEKCCNENNEPSCCTALPQTQAIWDQVNMWASVAGVIIAIAVLMFWCRNDGDFCWNRKDGSRFKYFCFGPLEYREGKGPEPNEDEDWDDDESRSGGI